MTVVINGTTGITTPDVDSTADITVNGITVGKGAGSVSTNTAVGASALAANTSGATNTAVGNTALQANTTGINNSAVGHAALVANLGGSENSAYGSTALVSNTSGSYNTAVGRAALYSNTTASDNTAVGYQAGYTNSTGSLNTFLGYQAGFTSNSGSAIAGNLLAGSFAGYYLTTGTNNTFVGAGNTGGGAAGLYVTTGSKNTIIGNYNGNAANLDIRTASNYIVLSDGDGNPRIFADNNGKVYFPFNNASAVSSGMEFSTDASYTYIQTYTSKPLKLNDLGNDVYIKSAYAATTASAANLVVQSTGLLARSTSSLKYKKNVQDAQYGLADVLNLRAVTYQAKDAVTKNDAGEDVTLPANEQVLGGLIAEEVHEAGLTQFVQYADDGTPDALAYANMASLFVKAIQELNAKIEAQAAEIAALKAA